MTLNQKLYLFYQRCPRCQKKDHPAELRSNSKELKSYSTNSSKPCLIRSQIEFGNEYSARRSKRTTNKLTRRTARLCIILCFLSNDAHKIKYDSFIPNSIFFPRQKAFINKIISNSIINIAHVEDDRDLILWISCC